MSKEKLDSLIEKNRASAAKKAAQQTIKEITAHNHEIASEK